MPTITQHAETSRKRTGKDYKELHEWMDANPRKKEERHDIGRIYEHGKMMEEKYGPEGLQEYLQHIRDDFLARFNNVKEVVDKALSEALAYLLARPKAKAKKDKSHRPEESNIEFLRGKGVSPDDVAHCLKVAEKALEMAELASHVIKNARGHWEVAQEKLTAERILQHLRPFAPSTVQKIVDEDPETPSLEKRDIDVSVLFLDVAGYTRISETHTREEITFIIEEYFSRFLDIIYNHGGDINETAGDGLMAIFQGPPVQNALNAAAAALEIRAKSLQINKELESRVQPIEINMGINSGIASVGITRFKGDAGSRMTFSATGPVTNLAARIAAAAKNGDVLVGPDTAERVKGEIKLYGGRVMKFKNVTNRVRISSLVAKSDTGKGSDK
jgi:class 3 adenylate cyclase